MTERVLTVRQPWADLIMAGTKDVENRTWPVPSTLPQWGDCPGHGRLWVHAGQQIDTSPRSVQAWATLRQHLGLSIYRGTLAAVDHVARGALLGSVTVTGCHQTRDCVRLGGENAAGEVSVHGCSRWADLGENTWHWTLADPIPLDEPWPLKGRQGLWTLPDGMDELIHLEHSA